MKSQGFSQTPQDIMEEYNGCSVPQYTAYRRVDSMYRVATLVSILSNSVCIFTQYSSGFTRIDEYRSYNDYRFQNRRDKEERRIVKSTS